MPDFDFASTFSWVCPLERPAAGAARSDATLTGWRRPGGELNERLNEIEAARPESERRERLIAAATEILDRSEHTWRRNGRSWTRPRRPVANYPGSGLVLEVDRDSGETRITDSNPGLR